MQLPHRRWNPLQEKWVLVSPQRATRPWLGEVFSVEKIDTSKQQSYKSDCYLCPGNSRTTGQQNPLYTSVFVFDNDFPALLPEINDDLNCLKPDHYGQSIEEIIKTERSRGICRVVCYSPDHSASLAELEEENIVQVIEEWEAQYKDLQNRSFIKHVMIFENRGEVMGSSNPHPHGQIWATESIPDIPRQSSLAQKKFFERNRKYLLQSYSEWELSRQERIIIENDQWIVVVPFWAVWPFEALVIPRRPVATIAELSVGEKKSWAITLKKLIRAYDSLFDCRFPYSMGVYQQPIGATDEWRGYMLHQVFFPPLLRSANVKKYMVGYELCAEPQRDLTPEQAASRLRGNVL